MSGSFGNDAPALRGLVLAGGRSTRFGRDKAAEEFAGSPLLSHVVALLTPLVTEVFVAVRADQLDEPLRRRFALIADEPRVAGPAAGMLAAHRRVPDGAWLVVACDMPLLNGQALGALIQKRTPDSAATAFRSPVDGLPEPLCAIYEPATLARFRRQVENGGSPSPRDFLVASAVTLVAPLRGEELANINTLEDLERLRRPA